MDKRIIDEKAKSEMCLCKTCMAEFRAAGYRVERVRALQETLDQCDFCHTRHMPKPEVMPRKSRLQ